MKLLCFKRLIPAAVADKAASENLNERENVQVSSNKRLYLHIPLHSCIRLRANTSARSTFKWIHAWFAVIKLSSSRIWRKLITHARDLNSTSLHISHTHTHTPIYMYILYMYKYMHVLTYRLSSCVCVCACMRAVVNLENVLKWHVSKVSTIYVHFKLNSKFIAAISLSWRE